MHNDHLHYFHQAAARDQVVALLDRVRLDPAYRSARIRRVEVALQIGALLVIAAVMAFSAWRSA